eukprot:NODE_3817_length_911_cov_52.715777_g3511_i0.p2 GENE.NODE_3817_length_911_cov_52.715777_g3511_i0~~NODE_3817_length_911_cov_52.715777_g3511_i0.p2  ORF type:complete len:118 (-),score=4.75 NODE_3817_length_911_cov_52.715777_g3511_i0:486-839(-)
MRIHAYAVNDVVRWVDETRHRTTGPGSVVAKTFSHLWVSFPRLHSCHRLHTSKSQDVLPCLPQEVQHASRLHTEAWALDPSTHCRKAKRTWHVSMARARSLNHHDNLEPLGDTLLSS